MKPHLIFRSCSVVNSVHGTTRPVPFDKAALIAGCLESLLISIRAATQAGFPGEFRLTVIDDHSSDECVHAIRSLLGTAPFRTELVSLQSRGNAASLLACYEHARAEAPDLIYFVEDDYLHASSAIPEMLDAYLTFQKQLNREVVIFPCDHPDRYRDPYPSMILAGRNRPWRSVLQTSGTFLLHRSTLDKYWPTYRRFADYGLDPAIKEDSTINLIYREVPCFSPLPSLTVHLQDEKSLSPYVDWKSWWPKDRI